MENCTKFWGIKGGTYVTLILQGTKVTLKEAANLIVCDFALIDAGNLKSILNQNEKQTPAIFVSSTRIV